MSDWQDIKPDWGIILGSGLGSFVDRLEILASVPYSEVEGLPQSKVPGHAGRFVFGRLSGRIVLVAAGRVHLYEGWSAFDVAAHVRWMHERGLRRLVLTNAAGTINPDYPPGDWMMLTDHINLTASSPLLGGPNFVDQSEIYSAGLRDQFARRANEMKMPLHQGVYAGMIGPQYETPAEIRMLRTMGADAVGMSTVHEAIQARALGMQVTAFSCLTNWGAGMSKSPLSHHEVMEAGRQAAGSLVELLGSVAIA